MKIKDLIIYDWKEVAKISRVLAIKIWKEYKPDLVVGISRGGNCVATIISEVLRKNMITICITRRKNDIEIHDIPHLITPIDDKIVNGKNVLLVDEIVVTGSTIEIAKKELLQHGAKSVKTCAVANRSNGTYYCDYHYILTEHNNVIFPWDYLVLSNDNKLIVHPEYKQICNELKEDLNGM